MKRSNKNKKANAKKKADQRKELEALYGVKLTYWRYQGRKGVYWSLLSKYIRIRDFKAYGTCISCGKKFNIWKDSQAGHYAPAGDCGFKLLFDKRNINAECSACNNPRFSPGKLIHYKNNLVKRYGEEYVREIDELYRSRQTTKEWTQSEYHGRILALQKELEEMDNATTDKREGKTEKD